MRKYYNELILLYIRGPKLKFNDKFEESQAMVQNMESIYAKTGIFIFVVLFIFQIEIQICTTLKTIQINCINSGMLFQSR